MSKEHKRNIRVFTDGSLSRSKHSPKLGSFAKSICGVKSGYGVHFPDEEIEDVGRKFTHTPITNQRAELYAIYKAIIYVSMYYTFESLDIYTDSKYSMDSLTVWIKNWKKNGWKTANNNEVLNQDIIRKIDKLLGKYKVNFFHVKAHTGKQDDLSKGNDVADMLAKRGSEL